MTAARITDILPGHAELTPGVLTFFSREAFAQYLTYTTIPGRYKYRVRVPWNVLFDPVDHDPFGAVDGGLYG